MQKFNYHSHTYRCGHADSYMQDEDYVKEYIKMGFRSIAFTDHCPEKNIIDDRPKIRMEYEQKNEYLNSIKNLKEKYKNDIEIKTGFEIEYLPDDEENLLELKNESDKIVLGQHFIYDNNKKLKYNGHSVLNDEELLRYSEYIQKAMEINLPDIIAHPDIFMLTREEFGEIEEKVANNICKNAEKYGIPLEINLNNIFSKTYYENRKPNNDSYEKQREKLVNVKYPCKEFWKIASNYNIKVLYGIDAHHKGQILLWKELVQFANEIIGQDTIEKLDFIEE